LAATSAKGDAGRRKSVHGANAPRTHRPKSHATTLLDAYTPSSQRLRAPANPPGAYAPLHPPPSAQARPRHHPSSYAPAPQNTATLNLESRKAWGSACGRPPPPGFASKLANPGGGRLERGLAPLASQPGDLAWFGFSSGLGGAFGYSPPPG